MKTTPKMYLAAAFMSLGAKLVGVDRVDRQHMKFQLSYSLPFSEEDEWFEMVESQFKDKSLMVNAEAFIAAIQELKVEVHK